jgi:ribosomal protein L32
MSTTTELLFDFDLSAPLGKRAKPPKKDHKCPHDRKNATGMEVCEACGDYGICATCGAGYIRIDAYYRHDTLCYPRSEIARMEAQLERARAEQTQRIEANAKEATA